jgi:hypothetical protein
VLGIVVEYRKELTQLRGYDESAGEFDVENNVEIAVCVISGIVFFSGGVCLVCDAHDAYVQRGQRVLRARANTPLSASIFQLSARDFLLTHCTPRRSCAPSSTIGARRDVAATTVALSTAST